MTTGDRPRRSENAFSLVRRLIGGGVSLVRLEVTRGRQELGEMLADTKVGAILLGIAAAIGFLVLISLDLTIILGVAALFAVIVPVAVAIIVAASFVLLLIAYVALGAGNWVIVGAVVVVGAIFTLVSYLGFTEAWFTALYVLVVQLSLVGLFALLGIRRVRIGPPEETISAVKEDIEWAKRLLRRD
jgi:hypothetical protein